MWNAPAIRADPEAKKRLRKAIELILDFYGFEFADARTGALRCTAGCEARFASLNTAFNHNFMRISRVLCCLSSTGWEHLVMPLLESLYEEVYVTGRLACCAQSFASHWVRMIGDGWEETARRQFPKVFAGS